MITLTASLYKSLYFDEVTAAFTVMQITGSFFKERGKGKNNMNSV